MSRLIPFAISSCLLSGIVFAENASAPQQELKRIMAPELSMAMMREVIIPNVAALKQEAETLKSSATELCKQPNPANLAQAQKAYQNTQLAWRKIEIAPIGPANNISNGRFFEHAGAPLDQIVTQSQSTPDRKMVDAEAYHYGRELPDGTAGMPAIAAFLFNGKPENTLQLLKQDKTCAYLQWQTQVVLQQVITQQFEWNGLIRGAEYDVSYPSQFVVEYLNQIILGLSSFQTSKLKGKAENWQDAKTQSTAAGIQSNLAGLTLLLEGKNGGIGLDDYLISRDKAAVWEKVAKQLKQLQSAANAFEGMPNEKSAAKVNAAADQLATTLKTDVATTLNIRIGKK